MRSWYVGLLALGAMAGCSRSNMLLLGRVEQSVAGRMVVVTDCYRFRVPPPVVENGAPGPTVHFAPCRDAVIVLRGDSVSVNGTAYGRAGPGDTIAVDHGVVHVSR